MSEKINLSSGAEQVSEIAESEVIKALIERGAEDESARELLMRWTEWSERRVDTPRQNIKFNLDKARLYRAAGFLDAAWESLESARIESFELEEDSLRIKAEKIMDEIDEKGA